MHELVEQGGQHVLLLLSIIVAGIAVGKWARGEKERRDALLISQHEQTRLLKRIDRELHPENGDRLGPTALDVLSRGIARNAEAIAELHAGNEAAHRDIHLRVDGIFEALGIRNGPKRSMSDRHKAERGDDE